MATTDSRRKGIRLVIILCIVVALAVTGIIIWTSRRATIRFFSEVASNDLGNLSVSIGGSVEQPKDPVANDPGYSFDGWYSDPNYLTEFDFDLPVQKDTTIYVKWVEKSFTVTVLRSTSSGQFDEVLWSTTGKYKSTVSLPGEDTYMNYTWMGSDDSRQTPFDRVNQSFLGFSPTPKTSGDFGYTYAPNSNFVVPNRSVQLYAVFRGEESNFTFNPNDGEGDSKEEKGYFNEVFTVPSSEGLSKRYYSFAYWCLDADGIPRDSSRNVVPSGDPNDETCANIYWPGQQFPVKSTEPMTLYAIWTRNKVNVMIDARGGSNSLGVNGDNLVDAGLEGGYDLSTIMQPAKNGYRLVSYNTSIDGLGVEYALDAVVTIEERDIVLYAIWQRLLTVGYSLNNTKVSDDKLHEENLNGAYEDFVGTEGEGFVVLGLPVTVELNNFQFLGWSLDNKTTFPDYKAGDRFELKESDFNGADKIFLYGVWQGDARALKLKNTSKNEVYEINSYYGRAEKLTSTPIHEDTNYYFVGWGTKETYDYKNPENYPGVIYDLGELFEMGSNPEIGQTNDILYSLWCPRSYAITYYLQGGELAAVAPGQSSYTEDRVYKETITLYSQATREGYRFMGWSISANSTECVYFDNGQGTGFTLTMPGNAMLLYAVWVKEFTITFYNNAQDSAGMVNAIHNKILGETFTIPTEEQSKAITRQNYYISAWSTKPEGGTEYAFGEVVELANSEMINLYAVWKGDARYIEIFNGVTKVLTLEGEYGQDIPLAFEEEIPGADPGQEIGGFYAMLKVSVGLAEERYTFDYGVSVRTTSLYFKYEGNDVDTLQVYIIWNNKYFNVSYELNGGTYNGDDNDDMSSYRKTEQYTKTITLVTGKVTKRNYEFRGWTEDLETGTPLYAAGAEFTIPARDVTLYAYWARIYSVNFNSNGGELIPDADEATLGAGSYAKGHSFRLPENIYQKTNYSFKCWNTRANGSGTSYSIGNTLTVSEDVTLYAIWEGTEVDITLISLDPGNPAYESQQISILPKKRFGETLSLASYASSITTPDQGLVLKGWKMGPNAPEDIDVEVDLTADYVIDQVGDITIYAVWAARKNFFTVNLSGGICDNSYNDKADQYLFRQSIDLATYSARITKPGYELIGYSNVSGSVNADYKTDDVIKMPNMTKKIYCVWQELAIITFDKNCKDDTMTNYVFEGIPFDGDRGDINLTAVYNMFKRENFTLVGWSTSSTSTTADAAFTADKTTYTISSVADIYLYAVWEGRAINVVFDSNGGAAAEVTKACKYGDVIDLSLEEYKRTHSDAGYTFDGWSKTSGYDNGNATVGNTFTVETADHADARIVLYAIWNKKHFTVTFDYGDSTLGTKQNPDGYDSRQFRYTNDVDVETFVLEARKRLGYKFLGWAQNIHESDPNKIYGSPADLTSDNPAIENKTFKMPGSNITLHAIWDPIYVDIIYISNTPTGATETWVGIPAGDSSYTARELYQLSFKLPTNYLTADKSVYVSVRTYRFNGWIVQGDSSATLRKAGESFQVNVNTYIVLVAQWVENTITVNVNANGGTIADGAISVGSKAYSIVEGQTFTFPADPVVTRPGYRIVSYSINNTPYTTSSIVINTSLIASEDIDSNTVKITINWIQIITVQFKINAPASESLSGEVATISADKGTQVFFPGPIGTANFFVRPYYQFVEWNRLADGSSTGYKEGDPYFLTESVTFFAIWEGNDRSLKLNFNTNKTGVSSSGTATKVIPGLKYGDKLDFSLSDYTGVCTETDASGYRLGGWTDVPYDAANPSAFYVKYEYGSTFTVTGADDNTQIVLYAVWVARSYKVFYNSNGGAFNDGSTVKQGAETTYGNNFIIDKDLILYNPSSTISYYTFKGWSTNANYNWETLLYPSAFVAHSAQYVYHGNQAINGFVMPSQDLTLYAIWEPVEIEISFFNDAEIFAGGSASSTIKIRYNKSIMLPSDVAADNQVIKADYLFDKWEHIDADRTTVVGRYNHGITLRMSESFLTDSEKASKKIFFVGTWIAQTVYVEINANEGSFSDGTTVRLFESAVGRNFVLPNVKDENNQLVREGYALKTFNLSANGSSQNYARPGASVEIPSLNDPKLSRENVEVGTGEGKEVIYTYVYRFYAQWVEAEAYIAISDNALLNPYYETLGEAIAGTTNSDYTVAIIKDCYVKSTINIPRNIELVAVNGNWIVKRYIDEEDETNTFKGNLFNIQDGGTLSCGDNNSAAPAYSITFDGGATEERDYSYRSIFNVVGNLNLYNGVFVVNSRTSTSGAAINVEATNANLTAKYVVFEDNYSEQNGGAICIALASRVEIQFCTFNQNTSKGNGGAISNSKSILLQENTFYGNSALASGGAVYNDGDGNENGGVVTDTTNTYNSNIATTAGGAIYNKGLSYTLTNSLFYSNNARTRGGAIANDETTKNTDNMTVKGCYFGDASDVTIGNTGTNGGAISNSGRLKVEGSFFYFNATSESGNGGAVHNSGSKANFVLSGCTFAGNKAADGIGGAINNASGILVIGEDGLASTICTFTANEVDTGRGFSLAVQGGTVTVYQASFTDHVYTGNTSYGGVIYLSSGIANIYNTTIKENQITKGYGGGILVGGGVANIHSAIIESNKAYLGGGIAVINSGTANFYQGEIFKNESVQGGGVYVKGVNAAFNLNGGIVGSTSATDGNIATGDASLDGLGGGIYNEGRVTVNGGTIQSNYSYGNGGGIYTNGTVTLVAGAIVGNTSSENGGAIYSDSQGGGTKGVITFACSTSVRMLIDGNLCADGSYPLGNYEPDGTSGAFYGNGIYTQTKVIVSGYMQIGYNAAGTILNDIFLAVRDTATEPTTKIVIYDEGTSYTLNSETRICITSVVAIMGDKLVLFPTTIMAKNEVAKFSFGGDDAGFRLDGKYLKLGNYAATIYRAEDAYYSSLTEAYLDAQDGEIIYLDKNIVLSNDLAVYEESNGLAAQQEALVGSNALAGVSILDTFYIAKKVQIVANGAYTITRGTIEGYMFTIVGEGSLELGADSPAGGSSLTIKGEKNVTTLSAIFVSQENEENPQLIINNGVTITENKSESGAAIYNQGYTQIKGGTITKNVAEAEDGGRGGAIYSEGESSYLEIIGSANINNNTAMYGGGVYIDCSTTDPNAMVMASTTAQIFKNTATNAGGGIYVSRGKVTLRGGIISENKSNKNNTSGLGGGGIYLASGTILETKTLVGATDDAANLQIIKNETSSNGGGVAVDNATFTFNIGTIAENDASANGGGVAIFKTNSAATTEGMFESKNTSYLNLITKNMANQGGGIAVMVGTAKISYIKMAENIATSRGGGIFNKATLQTGLNTFIGNPDSSKGNIAAVDGGGIFNDGTISQFESNTTSGQNLTLCFNEATGGFGGGLANSGNITTAGSQAIYKNRAESGGGIANIDDGELILNSDVSISQNTATSSATGGGGIYNSATIEIHSGTTTLGGAASTPNQAVNGGGIFNIGTFHVGKASALVAAVLAISYNTATVFGGGIYLEGGSFVNYSTSAVTVNNNTQTSDIGGGGGICVAGGTLITKAHNDGANFTISQNSSEGAGGGIYVSGSSEEGVILNKTKLSRNNASARGGGIAVISGVVKLGDPTNGRSSQNEFDSNTSVLGGNLFLQTSIYVNENIYSHKTNGGEGDVYLANARTYLIFSKSSNTTSYYPHIDLVVKVNSFTDGRRIAKFQPYTKVDTITGADGNPVEVEYQVSFAGDHYKKFACVVSSNYGVNFDDNGFVILAEPVAYNITKNQYYSTLAVAAAQASSDDNILITKSHTVTDQILIVDKNLTFLISDDIILTRGGTFLDDMFRVFTTKNDTTYTVTINPVKTVSGTTYGSGFTLTLDGNRNNVSLKSTENTRAVNRGSLLGVSGGYYLADSSGKFVAIFDSNIAGYSGYTSETRYALGDAELWIPQIGIHDGSVYTLRYLGNEVTPGTVAMLGNKPARANVTVRATNFINNVAGTAGGAICYRGYSAKNSSTATMLSLTECLIENCETLKNLNGEYEELSMYGNGQGGGAIFAMGGKLKMRDSNVRNNKSAANGGAIQSLLQSAYARASGSYSYDSSYLGVDIATTQFLNNTAFGSGGAINIVSTNTGYDTFKLNDDVVFYGNVAGYRGGAIAKSVSPKIYVDWVAETDRIISTYSSSSTSSLKQLDTYEEAEAVEIDGHTKYQFPGDARYFGSNVLKSVSYIDFVPPASNIEYQSRLYLYGSVAFEGNMTTGINTNSSLAHGGAIYCQNLLYITANSVRIVGNSATGSGGGIYSDYNTYLNGGVISDNSSRGYGGGIYVKQEPTTTFAKVNITGNTALYDGGGIYFEKNAKIGLSGGSYSSGYGCIITGNTSETGNGGGVAFMGSYGYIFGGTIDENTAAKYGGGIYIPAQGPARTISAYLYQVSSVSNNKTGFRGGGIYSWSSVLINGTTTGSGTEINSNEVYATEQKWSGGAGLWSYWEIKITGTVNFLNNQFTADTTSEDGGGGAIWILEDELWLTHSYYQYNNNTYSMYNPETYKFRNDVTAMPESSVGGRYSSSSVTVGNTVIPYAYFYDLSSTVDPQVSMGTNWTYSGGEYRSDKKYSSYSSTTTINDKAAHLEIKNLNTSADIYVSIQYKFDPLYTTTTSYCRLGWFSCYSSGSTYNYSYNTAYTYYSTGSFYIPAGGTLYVFAYSSSYASDANNTNALVINSIELSSTNRYYYANNYANVTISGNSAGVNRGNGIFYWGREMFVSGSVQMDDDIFMRNDTISKIVVDNFLVTTPNTYTITYASSPAENLVAVRAMKGVTFAKDTAAMFGITNSNYYLELSSSSSALDSTNNIGNYSNSVRELVFKTGSVAVNLVAKEFDTAGEKINGGRQGQVRMSFGESMSEIYNTLKPSKPGHNFAGFNIEDDSGTVLSSYYMNSLISIEGGSQWYETAAGSGMYKTTTELQQYTSSSVNKDITLKVTAMSACTVYVTMMGYYNSSSSYSYGCIYYNTYNASGNYSSYGGYYYPYSSDPNYSSGSTYSFSLSAGYTIAFYMYKTNTSDNFFRIWNITATKSGDVPSTTFPQFPTRAALSALFGGSLPESITMSVIWEESAYTLWVHKYILDKSTTYGSLSTYVGQYSKAYNTANSYQYTIHSNEKFDSIITDLETQNSTVDPTVKKNYLRGYEIVGYMLSYDRKYYTKTDVYPYNFGYVTTSGGSSGGKISTDLYIVYRTAEYTLTFNADEYSELLTDKNTLKAKYSEGISLLSANLIYRKGYRLAAWLGSDGEEYAAPGGDDTVIKTYEIISGTTTYPMLDSGGEYTSTNQGLDDTSSSVYIKILQAGYFNFQYFVSSQSSDRLYLYKNGSQQTYYSNSGSSINWYSTNLSVIAGDVVEFRYTKNASTSSNLDTAGVRNFSVTMSQTVYSFESDVSFTPKWEPIPFDVRVYYNYPDGGTSFKIYSVYAGDSIADVLNQSKIPDPSGYTLKGYSYESGTGATLLGASDVMPGEDIVLYAHWQANTVVITYYDAEWNILFEQSVLYGSEVQLYEHEGIDFWRNYGDQLVYSPGGTFLVGNDGRYYLQFIPVTF